MGPGFPEEKARWNSEGTGMGNFLSYMAANARSRRALMVGLLLAASAVQATVGKETGMTGEAGLVGEYRIVAEDGIRIRYVVETPEDWMGDAIFVLTGRAETVEKYDRVARRLLARGLRVVRMDWRGQGGSDRLLANPHKGHVAAFADYLRDLDQLLQQESPKDGRTFILAHSMGAHIALRHVMDHPDAVDGMILVSGMFRIQTDPLPGWLASGIARIAVWLGNADRYLPGAGDYDPDLPFAGNDLTGNPEEFQRFRELLAKRPSLQLGGPTYGWLAASCVSRQKLDKRLLKTPPDLPILVLAGSEDRVVSVTRQKEVASLCPDSQYRQFDGARHELLMEREEIQDAVWASLLQFLARVR